MAARQRLNRGLLSLSLSLSLSPSLSVYLPLSSMRQHSRIAQSHQINESGHGATSSCSTMSVVHSLENRSEPQDGKAARDREREERRCVSPVYCGYIPDDNPAMITIKVNDDDIVHACMHSHPRCQYEHERGHSTASMNVMSEDCLMASIHPTHPPTHAFVLIFFLSTPSLSSSLCYA